MNYFLTAVEEVLSKNIRLLYDFVNFVHCGHDETTPTHIAIIHSPTNEVLYISDSFDDCDLQLIEYYMESVTHAGVQRFWNSENGLDQTKDNTYAFCLYVQEKK